MSTLNRIKNISWDELYVRGSQRLAALAERFHGSSTGKLPDDEALLALLNPLRSGNQLTSATQLLQYFQTRDNVTFFGGFADREATVRELRRRWPSAETQLVEQANRIVSGKFDLLGYRNLSFGSPIDWHLEPVAEKRTPLIHWSRLNYLDSEVAGDKKIIWELNRHQYFATLGQAYWLTHDERYAETFVQHLESWMIHNPPKLGINWASSLEVAFRSISWLWALYFFKDAPSLRDDTFTRVLKFLYLNARHLEIYLSTYFSPNTHLTGEALGLFYLGTLLPEFEEARRWRDTGREILLTQLERHVKADGVYFEQSSYYHRYTTDFYLHFLILSRRNHESVATKVEKSLTALLDHLMYITRPDGTTPFFGDDDGGRLVKLDQRSVNDFRAPLATSASLFNRADHKFVAAEAAEETLWLLGTSGLEQFDVVQASEPEMKSVAFEDGGYYVMRDCWGPKGNYLLFDSGPHGALNCGHAHADALSFELAASGRTMLVDPGTYTYTRSKKLRDWFRSSPAHNTLTVDGEPSSVPKSPFSWQDIAECHAGKWTSRERFDYVEGTHSGYARLQRPTAHTRSILFLKNDYWIIRDHLNSTGEHRADLWFHFDVGVAPLIEYIDSRSTAITEHGVQQGLSIMAFAEGGQWRREEGWVSHCYGERAPGRVYVFSAPTKLSTAFVTFLFPDAGASSVRRVAHEAEAIGGRAFEIAHEDWLDVTMIRAAERVESARLVSDFEWTWARFASGDETNPTELVLLNGRTLELNGRRVLQSEEKIDYLIANRIGDQFRVETNQGAWELPLPLSDFGDAFARLPF